MRGSRIMARYSVFVTGNPGTYEDVGLTGGALLHWIASLDDKVESTSIRKQLSKMDKLAITSYATHLSDAIYVMYFIVLMFKLAYLRLSLALFLNCSN